MNAAEAHQLELENRQRDEWEAHRSLVNEFGRECRAYLNQLLNRKGTHHANRPELTGL